MNAVTIYCDGQSDEIAAEWFLKAGPLPNAEIKRLPRLQAAPAALKALLTWERLDWIVTVDGEPRCTVELSRHGYTGDNGFQRFARLYRSAALGIPTIYFTPFTRTRLNELDDGLSSARNVAPELFATLAEMEAEFGVACIALAWPTGGNGQAAPLQSADARPAMEELARVVARLVEEPPTSSVGVVRDEFPRVVEAMKRHGEITFRGSDTRNSVDLPIDIGSPDWVYDFLPDNYFSVGKAEKALASLALDSCDSRPLSGAQIAPFWEASEGQAWILYLGYQWRLDPACGLIALAAAQARKRPLPLVVVWPRVFSSAGGKRAEMLAALQRFKTYADGPLADELARHGRGAAIPTFSDRVSVEPGQFGVFTPGSKIGRVLKDTASAVVFGDVVLRFVQP